MNEEDRKFVKRWKKQRQRRWQFLLKVGVLYWGVPTFLVYWLFTYFLEQQVTIDTTWLIVHLLGFSAAGLAYAFFQFRSNEKLYDELTKH